jgi:biopolymer transport protein TolR
MAMSTGAGGGLTNEPNVTPMIDVLLVLLIIFMMTIPLMRSTCSSPIRTSLRRPNS